MELSDFHLMTLTVMKICFRKLYPRLINYRWYKDFTNEEFRKDLKRNVASLLSVILVICKDFVILTLKY